MDKQSLLSDSVVPAYRFEWDDGSSRTTEELPRNPEGIEALAELGRQDPDCSVTLLGYES